MTETVKPDPKEDVIAFRVPGTQRRYLDRKHREYQRVRGTRMSFAEFLRRRIEDEMAAERAAGTVPALAAPEKSTEG